MSQPRYLLKPRADAPDQVDDFIVLRLEKKRTKLVRSVGGLAFREVERTGQYHADQLELRGRTGPLGLMLDAFGRKTSGPSALIRPRSAAGVKAVLRRLRPEEAVELDRLDGEIRETEEWLKALRRVRKETVRKAWGSAHVVRLSEVEDALKEREAG